MRAKVPNYGRHLRLHEQTIAETLEEAGYTTGLFGKFHVGSAQPDSPCNPSAMGLDEWCIGLNFFDKDSFISRNGVIEHREGKGSALLVDDALECLGRHKDGDASLFTVVRFPLPHDPHDEVPVGPALYEGKKPAGYFREITLLGQQLGRLRIELCNLGSADDTLLWYCSNNGGLIEDSWGGRARKGSIYEGGLGVPALLECPARELRGRTRAPVCTTDMYPMLLSPIGMPPHAPHPLDGIDVSSFLNGAT